MFCALFGSHFLLAVPVAGNPAFEIVAVINLSDVQIDNPETGKGEVLVAIWIQADS